MALGRQCNASIYTQQTAQTSKSHNKNENCNFYDSRESAAVARSRKKSELYGSEISLIVNFKPNSKKRENSAIKKKQFVCSRHSKLEEWENSNSIEYMHKLLHNDMWTTFNLINVKTFHLCNVRYTFFFESSKYRREKKVHLCWTKANLWRFFFSSLFFR